MARAAVSVEVRVWRYVERDNPNDCLYGHPLDGLQRSSSNGVPRLARYCKTCKRERVRKARVAKRE